MRLYRRFSAGSRSFAVLRRLVILAALLPFLAACGRSAVQGAGRAADVHSATVFNRLFARTEGGWTGGDGTLSVALPDGRTLWMFGDTFLGRVRPDGSRPVESPLIRNCLVVQTGLSLETLHGGTDRQPEAFLTPDDAAMWYWPGDGTAAGDRVWLFFHRFRQVSPGMWGWGWNGTVIAALKLPELVLERVAGVADDNGVAYGAALHEEGPWLYIFGIEQGNARLHMHLARAPRENPEGPWCFWTGREWTDDPRATRPMLSGVGSRFGVVRLAGGIGLVTMDLREPFSKQVVLYAAAGPTGPWEGPLPIYRAPEADADIAAYNAFVHPQFTRPEGYLISYNLNHVRDPEALYADAAIYRPRFIRADLDRLIGRRGPGQ